MSVPRNETREVVETITLGGVEVKVVLVSYDYQYWSRNNDRPVERVNYKETQVGRDTTDLDGLNDARIVLEALAQPMNWSSLVTIWKLWLKS